MAVLTVLAVMLVIANVACAGWAEMRGDTRQMWFCLIVATALVGALLSYYFQ